MGLYSFGWMGIGYIFFCDPWESHGKSGILKRELMPLFVGAEKKSWTTYAYCWSKTNNIKLPNVFLFVIICDDEKHFTSNYDWKHTHTINLALCNLRYSGYQKNKKRSLQIHFCTHRPSFQRRKPIWICVVVSCPVSMSPWRKGIVYLPFGYLT